MRKRASMILGAAVLSFGLLAAAAPAGASVHARTHARLDGRAYLRTYGYLPIHGAATLARAKAAAARWAAAQHPGAAAPTFSGRAPTIRTTWQGVSQSGITPPDANGAIGPNSYVETINDMIGIYQRNGTKITSASLTTLTGHGGLSDPMVLWDPDTQRFYYNVWNTTNAKMDWGFSKSNNPTTVPGGFCNYETAFGYAASNAPDYPKLGQTKNFLMIGVNFYTTFSDLHAQSGDLLWLSKPQGSGTITTCPAASTFKSGKFAGLKNQDGTLAFTPVPAIQTDPSKVGQVMAMSDIECPDICGNGALITTFSLQPSTGDPTVPKLSKGRSATVATYTSPPNAPQKGSGNPLNTLDGRITHAVSGLDPRFGKTAVWVAHTVKGGAGAQIRWYEADAKTGAVLQSGTVTNASLYVFDAGISNDRTVNLSGAAHGSAMVLGFTTSSSTAFAAIQMVSKVGAGAQSGFVLVKQSMTADTDFSCGDPSRGCRWGDYGGATPDPAASLAATNGEVWLTNQWTNGSALTWNWEAKP